MNKMEYRGANLVPIVVPCFIYTLVFHQFIGYNVCSYLYI